MTKLFSIFIIFISGCTTVAPTLQVIQTSHDINVISKKERYGQSDLTYEWKSIIVENYDDLKVGGIDAEKAEAMSIVTGEKFHIGNWPWGFFMANDFQLVKTVIENCEILFNSECILTRTSIGEYVDGKYMSAGVYYNDLEDYEKKIEEKRFQEIQMKKEEQISYEKRKQDAFNKLYITCTDYGFSVQNEIASCIQQEIFNEKKLAILKEQQLIELQNINNQQRKEKEETSFWLQLLEGVAETLADPNTWENARQNAEIQRLKNQQRRTIPNVCFGSSCN